MDTPRLPVMNNAVQQILAIDFGLKRLGIAIANTLTKNAEPLQTLHIENTKTIPKALLQLIKEWQPDKLIMGMPYNADGSESKMAKQIRAFALLLSEQCKIPLEYIDESFSSHEASRQLKNLRQSGERKKRVIKGDLDKISAAIMLQRWLDTEKPDLNKKPQHLSEE